MWAYDVMGRVLTDRRSTSGVTRDFTYQYNLDGSLWKLTYPSGRIITYSYNAAARLTAAQDVAGGVNYATGASYTAGGALRSLHHGASIVATYYYNNRLQPCRISAKHSGTAPTNCADATNIGNIVDFSYNFDSDPAPGVQNNGNVGAIANNITPARSQSFTYDELNRIATAKTQATSGQYCWGETFSYDIWANLKTIGALVGYTGCTQESFSPTQITNKNQLPTSDGYQYDAAGNLTSATGMGSYTWDAESRMKATAGVTYTYDGDGRRVKKSTGKLYWYGLGLDVLLETDAAGNTPDEYIFFGGKRVARRQSAGTVSYYFSDHLGSSRVVTNATGTTVLDDSDFYPFGGERPVVNNDPNQYKFTGHERDTESNTDHAKARQYSFLTGRMMSPDPAGLLAVNSLNPQGWNFYAYALNNPIRYSDPTGLYVTDCKADDQACADEAAKFEEARKRLLESENEEERAAAEAYGNPGIENGVTVSFVNQLPDNANGTTTGGLGSDAAGNLRAEVTVQIKKGQTSNELERTVGHEGSHVEDRQNYANNIWINRDHNRPFFMPGVMYPAPMNLTKYRTESKAYMLTVSIAKRQNDTIALGGNDKYKLRPTDPSAVAADTVNRFLADKAYPYRVTPQNQGEKLYPKNP